MFREGRREYAIRRDAIGNQPDARRLTAFFFWSAWAAAAHRPGEAVSYTNNWPHEPLIGNVPTSDMVVWTGVSILFLLAGIGAMAAWHAARKHEEPLPAAPRDPLPDSSATPSQLAVRKYFWTVAGAVWPALSRKDDQRPILTLFVISAAAIASFYFAALGYGRHTNLAIAEYWRWGRAPLG